MSTITGSCLCESVRYEVNPNFKKLNICHCKQCQRATGSAHASNLFVDPNSFRWTSGQTYVKRHDVAGRSITNSFCTECGSTLPYKSRAGDVMIVPAGTLDESLAAIPAVANIFWEERANWYAAALAADHYDRFADPA